jgi:hypothetical protein
VPDPTASAVANNSKEIFQARAEDVDDHANFQLQDDSSDSESESGFFDAHTWDSDDEDGMHNVI